MKVVEGSFGKKKEEDERPSVEFLLADVMDKVDITEVEDVVILLGTDEGFTLAGNVSTSYMNLMIDRAKAAIV